MSGVNRATLPWNTQIGDTVRRKRMKKLMNENPCISSPAAPTNLALVFDFNERAKHDRIRAKCSFDSVQNDADGFGLTMKIDRYVVEFQHAPTSDHNNDDWADEPRHHVVNAIDPDWMPFVSNLSLDTIVKNKHGFRNGERVVFRGGQIPSPLVAGTVYWVVQRAEDTFKVSTTQGGIALNLTGTGSPGGEVGYYVPHRYNIWFRGQIQKRKWYRFRVRAIDKDKKRSDWSAWEPLHGAQPADTTPPPTPLLVNIHQNANDRIVVDWDDPLDVDDPEVVDEDIAFYQVQISKQINFSTIYRHDRFHVASHRSFRVKPVDASLDFYARVRSVDSSRNKSAWVPAKVDPGNSNPAATPDSAKEGSAGGVGNPPNQPSNPSLVFDGRGTRHAKYRAIVTAGTSTGGDAPHRYVIQLAHDATGGASPPAGVKRKHGSVEGDATGDDLQEVFRNIPKGHFVWVRERARNAGGASAWTGWVGGVKPSGSGVAVAPNQPSGVNSAFPVPGRMVTTWTDPDDDETIRWRVEIRKNAILVETGFTRSPRFVYNIPENQRGQTHTARVFAISETGTDSSQQDSLGGNDPASSSDPIGSVKWHSGPNIPGGHLHADGSGLNTTTFPKTFAALGYTYGGSGTTFNLPDIKNRKVKGKGNLYALNGNDGLAEGSRDHNHNHGGHRHGTHKHAGHKHNGHGHNAHGHSNHGHDGHVGATNFETGGHSHGAGSLSTSGTSSYQYNSMAAQGTRFGGDHSHGIGGTAGPKDSSHNHSSQGNGQYIQGTNAFASGYHGLDGTQSVGSAHTEDGGGEAFNDNQGDQAEATNDGKKSPYIVQWAIIRVDDL